MRLTEKEISSQLSKALVESFLQDLYSTNIPVKTEQLEPRMPSNKIRKLATIMAGSTGAGA